MCDSLLSFSLPSFPTLLPLLRTASLSLGYGNLFRSDYIKFVMGGTNLVENKPVGGGLKMKWSIKLTFLNVLMLLISFFLFIILLEKLYKILLIRENLVPLSSWYESYISSVDDDL